MTLGHHRYGKDCSAAHLIGTLNSVEAHRFTVYLHPSAHSRQAKTCQHSETETLKIAVHQGKRGPLSISSYLSGSCISVCRRLLISHAQAPLEEPSLYL
jgi:hypothetical protein